MRNLFIFLALMISNLAFSQIDFSDKSNFVDLGGLVESAKFAAPYKTTLAFAVISQEADGSDAAALKDGITCTIDFLYFSPGDSKLTFTAYDRDQKVIGERRWRNVSLYLQKFKNGSIGYEITDETGIYSYARIYPQVKGNKYWCFFNPILRGDIL